MVLVPLPNMISSCGFWSSCVNHLGPDARETQSEAPVHTTGAWKPPVLLSRFLPQALNLTRETVSAVLCSPGSQRLLPHCLLSGARFCLTPARGLFCLLRKQDSQSW